MQVGSSGDLASQLQTLENAALGKYQDSQGFNFLLQQADQTDQAGGSSSSSGTSSGSTNQASSGSSSGSPGGYAFSGSFTGTSLIAVGTFGADGHMIPFSQQQIQSEYAAVANAGKSAYANALQNFMTLSEAGGQLSTGTLTDHESYSSGDGMVSANFDTSLTLKTVGGGVPTA